MKSVLRNGLKVKGRDLFKITFLSLLIVLVSGCNSSETGNESRTDDVSESSNPKQGGTVTMPIEGDPTFNPWHPSAYIESIFVNRVLFNGLTKAGKEGQPVGDLAKDWEVSDDELEWTFNLREDVTWHDGEPFTAEDVAFTFNEIVLADTGANNSSSYNTVKSVEVIDSNKVVFQLERPFATLLAHLAYNAEILPKHKFEGEDPWELTSFNKDEPVGTGPFKLDNYTSGQTVELIANPNYFGDPPNLEKLVYKVLSDANTHVAQALSNELSLFVLDDYGSVERIENADHLEIHPQDLTRFDMMSPYQENPLFKDVLVRQALMHAIDREKIINTVLHGYADVAHAGISPSLEHYYTDDVEHYDYDPEKAKNLLAEAGWEDTTGDGLLDKDGENFSFVLDVGQIGEFEAIGQMVHQNLLEIGLDVELNVMEWNSLMDKVANRDYDVYMSWWNMPNDPDVLPYFHSSAVEDFNRTANQDPELDELLELGQETSDPDERQEIYYEVQKIMAETVPYQFMWYPQELQVRNNNLKGLPELQYREALQYVEEWWVEQ